MKFLLLAFFMASAHAQRSGLDYASDEIRRLQASDAENPGMLWVDRGEQLFAKECAACHASMKGVASRYPKLENNRAITLGEKIRHPRPGLAWESEDFLALLAWVASQSRGMPMPRIEEKAAEKGKAEYFRRRGQMNLACTHCHDASAGRKLGAETVSEGQPNGYPSYRLEWQKLGSLQRRLRACMFGVHAEIPEYGSELLNDLELYLAFRAKGLPIEAPAVRR